MVPLDLVAESGFIGDGTESEDDKDLDCKTPGWAHPNAICAGGGGGGDRGNRTTPPPIVSSPRGMAPSQWGFVTAGGRTPYANWKRGSGGGGEGGGNNSGSDLPGFIPDDPFVAVGDGARVGIVVGAFLSGSPRVTLAMGDNENGQSYLDYGSDFDNWVANTGTVAGMFLVWASGWMAGITVTFENDRVADAMRNAPGVKEARDYFYDVKYKDKKISSDFDLTDYFGSFNPFNAGIDPVEQFIGSYSVDIKVVSGNMLEFTLSNTTGIWSGSYHTLPDHIYGPGGNIYQKIIFTEPIRKGR